MAIARLHGGPLDGQLLPLENSDLDRLIVPYSETQVVYVRKGGRRVIFTEGELVGADGAVLATGTSSLLVIDRRDGSGD